MTTLRVALRLRVPLSYAEGLLLDMRQNYLCRNPFAMPLLRVAVGNCALQERRQF
jgi:hypothetical protein